MTIPRDNAETHALSLLQSAFHPFEILGVIVEVMRLPSVPHLPSPYVILR